MTFFTIINPDNRFSRGVDGFKTNQSEIKRAIAFSQIASIYFTYLSGKEPTDAVWKGGQKGEEKLGKWLVGLSKQTNQTLNNVSCLAQWLSSKKTKRNKTKNCCYCSICANLLNKQQLFFPLLPASSLRKRLKTVAVTRNAVFYWLGRHFFV